MPFQDRTDGSVFYLDVTTAPLHAWSKPDPSRRPKDPAILELLWGDRVRRMADLDTGEFIEADGRWRVKARGTKGWIDPEVLGHRSLLEFYFIDVGQGDGVLIRTPNNRHILIDGGWPRKRQPTGKNAADFVDWKFMRDYETELRAIELDALLCSHNDLDHYGGLWDLLDSTQWREGDAPELDARAVLVEAIYHAGISWWDPGDRTLGPWVETDEGRMFTQLLGDRASVERGLRSDIPDPERLQGNWADFLEHAVAAKTSDGEPTPIERLSSADRHLPGFEPTGDRGGSDGGPDDDGSDGVAEPVVHVFAPVNFEVDGQPAVRRHTGGASINTNGNSLLLRVDLGDFRFLLTGDLNRESQNALLVDYQGREDVFACDVAKGCHHGSDDISFRFLEAMQPQVTVLTSGDSEGHDHPRPSVIAASAITGWRTVEDDELKTPLIYCTELARSVQIGRIVGVDDVDDSADPPVVTALEPERLTATTEVTMVGDLHPRTVRRDLRDRHLVTGTVYGLVNVRTDGSRVVCAALNEKDRSWNVSEISPKVTDPE